MEIEAYIRIYKEWLLLLFDFFLIWKVSVTASGLQSGFGTRVYLWLVLVIWVGPGPANHIWGVAGARSMLSFQGRSWNGWEKECKRRQMQDKCMSHTHVWKYKRYCSHHPAASCECSAVPVWAASVWSWCHQEPVCPCPHKTSPAHLPLTHIR